MVKEMTHIRVRIETWNRLKDRKQRPSHIFDEIINELLDEVDEVKS